MHACKQLFLGKLYVMKHARATLTVHEQY